MFLGYLGAVTILSGVVILHLSQKKWYLQFLKDIMPDYDNPSRREKKGAVVVIVFGIFLYLGGIISQIL